MNITFEEIHKRILVYAQELASVTELFEKLGFEMGEAPLHTGEETGFIIKIDGHWEPRYSTVYSVAVATAQQQQEEQLA